MGKKIDSIYRFKSYRKGSNNARGGEFARIIGDRTEKIKKNPLQNGPRIIFLTKYNETGSYLQAKQELKDRGFGEYDDEILQTWIKEGCKTISKKDEKGDER